MSMNEIEETYLKELRIGLDSTVKRQLKTFLVFLILLTLEPFSITWPYIIV